jgi:hypothetical protein
LQQKVSGQGYLRKDNSNSTILKAFEDRNVKRKKEERKIKKIQNKEEKRKER